MGVERHHRCGYSIVLYRVIVLNYFEAYFIKQREVEEVRIQYSTLEVAAKVAEKVAVPARIDSVPVYQACAI